MPAWVVDRSIPVLFGQINAAAPTRDKSSDGTIGDAAHQARESQHNPESPPPPGNPDDQVDAGDITHDPKAGADMGVVAESIRLSRDRRVLYVIFNRRIFYGYDRAGLPAFTWTSYSGSDPHTGHLHVSVNDVHHDETQLWEIGIGDMALTPEQESWLYNASSITASMARMQATAPIRDGKNKPVAVALELKMVAAVVDHGERLAALEERPPVEAGPIDVLALQAVVRSVLMEPGVQDGIAAAFGRLQAAGLRASADVVDGPPV